MSNLQNEVDLFLKDEKHQHLATKAQEMFREKSFLERFYSLQVICTYSRFILPVFSIATGCFFISSLLYSVTSNFLLSIIVSIVLLTLYEAMKINILHIGLKCYYEKYKLGSALLILSIPLAMGSAFISIQGAKEIYVRNDTSSQLVDQYYNHQMDSIGNKIAELEALKPSRWGGLLSKSENTMILNYQNEIKALRAERRQELNTSVNNTTYNKYIIGCIAATVELLIMLSVWFYIFYFYMCYKEQQVLNTPFEFRTSNQNQSFENKKLNSKTVAMPIGFQSKSVERRDGESKEKEIERAIRGGMKDFRTLMRTFKLNVNQTRKYINKYSV